MKLNPFYCQSLAFAFSLILIMLPFSDLYGPPSVFPLVIIALYIILSLFLGGVFHVLTNVSFFCNSHVNITRFDYWLSILFVFLACAEFVWSGFPVFGQVDYKEFGIPMVHVIVYSIGLYLSVLASLTMVSRFKNGLFFVVALLMYGVLIVSRHFILMVFLNVLMAYYFSGRVKIKQTIFFLFLMLLVMWLFGFLGTYRMSEILGVTFDQAEQYILDTSKASDLYKKFDVGASLYWFWLYCTSPLSNLIQTIDLSGNDYDLELNNILNFIVSELMPQTFSKRLIDYFGIWIAKPYLVVPNLNVATGIASSYRYLGFLGLVLFCFYNFLVLLIGLLIIKNDQTKKMFLCFYSALFIFFIFDNMTAFPPYYVCGMLFIYRGYFCRRTGFESLNR